MTGEQIINKFKRYTRENTSFSDDDLLDRANEVYQLLNSSKDYEFLQKKIDLSVSNGVATLPSDFRKIAISNIGGAYKRFVVIGTRAYEYKELSETLDNDFGADYDICYKEGNTLKFSETITGTAKFVYIHNPEDIELDTEPVHPSYLHNAIVWGMKADNSLIEEDDRERTYYSESDKKFMYYIKLLSQYDN